MTPFYRSCIFWCCFVYLPTECIQYNIFAKHGMKLLLYYCYIIIVNSVKYIIPYAFTLGI